MDEAVVAALVKTGKWSEGTARLFERAKYKCEYCGYDLLVSVDTYKLLEVDHIVPLSAGGDPAHFENLALSCRHCNWHLKRSWDPRITAGNDASREMLVASVRKYVAELREKRKADLAEVQRIVGYKTGDV